MRLKYRIVGGVGALLFAGAALVTSNGVGGAVEGGKVSDIVNFSGKAFVAVPPTAGQAGTGSTVAKQCALASDGESRLFPCTLTGLATLTRTGGTLTGTIRSGDGIIQFRETFVYTSLTTGVGTGTVKEFDFDDRCSTTGTMTASFTTQSTSIANIFTEQGNIVVSDNPNQACDSDNGPTTTTPPTTAGV